ncbi:hypothetical protein EMIHUDRAFT_199605, partial [Emiliania huxleyi CCMP1516]|uniref:Right handed beta helix domain-containing protein n=2 Tax=Emiliania huxleyi TaxID=2903 RepID=A0A0D3KZW8_EMIH1
MEREFREFHKRRAAESKRVRKEESATAAALGAAGGKKKRAPKTKVADENPTSCCHHPIACAIRLKAFDALGELLSFEFSPLGTLDRCAASPAPSYSPAPRARAGGRASVRVNLINNMSENKTEVKARIMPAEDGSIKVVFFSAPKSPPPLVAKALRASGAKNAPVEDDTVAVSGAATALDESILKQDLAAEGATAAETVDSDRAKAMFSAHTPSANADFWSKLARSTDPPTAPNGVTKNGPALEPVAKVATAVKPAAAGGETLPSTKEFPAEEPAPSGIADWTTPSNPRRKNGRKGASAPIVRTKSITPVGGKNRFGALLGTDGNEGILGGTGKVTGGSTPPTADSGATVDVETTTNTTPEGSAAGRFPWSKSYNLLRLFGILALICLGAAFAHSSCSATSALLSSQRYDSPWPTSPPATVAKPFTPASPNGFCEVGGNDTSSFAAIVSSDSAPANHPGGHEDGPSWEALMEAIKEAVGEPLHLIGEPPASVKDLYEKQPVVADLETAPASRNTMERKGEPEIDSIGPVYSSRSGIIVRETVLPVNGTSPEMRSADAHAEPAWPAEVRAAQISDSNSVQSDISSVSRVCADRQPRCAAPVAWHAEPHHALTDERSKTDKPPANAPVDKLSIDLPSPFHFPFMSGPSSSAPVRTQQRCQFWAALFVLLGACGGVLPSVRRSSSGRLVRCRTGARRGAWLLILAALLPLACAPSDHTSGSIDFQVTVGGGSYPSEVSWTLVCSGALIGSGGAPYSRTLSAPPGECTLDMYDSYDDGWTGNEWKGAGYTFTLDSGSSGTSKTDCSAGYVRRVELAASLQPLMAAGREMERATASHPDLSSQPQSGGVVYAYVSGAVSIIDSDVRDCSAEYGGGVVLASSSGAVSITSSNVTGCSAGTHGGVVDTVQNSGSVSISGSTVSGCSAWKGGVVHAYVSGAVSIIGSAVTGCSANKEGGVVYATNSESLSIAGVDFIDNRAGMSGSVLYLDGLRQRPSISAASFTGNTAGDDNDGATIQAVVISPINWDCRLGSWMPRKGSFFGDFSVP